MRFVMPASKGPRPYVSGIAEKTADCCGQTLTCDADTTADYIPRQGVTGVAPTGGHRGRGVTPEIQIQLTRERLMARRNRFLWCFIPAVFALGQATAQDVGSHHLFPPEIPWSGASEQLIVPSDHPWITPAESTGLTETPRYDETIAWLSRLVDTAPELTMFSIGKSAEGRDIWMVTASKEGASTPRQLDASGKPTVLVHAGIHSGEIDGKDAGLMLLRDMTVVDSRIDLLDHVNLLFIPILSVDGHERFSRYSRINQRGPREMGWRTNSRNLNLNRDFTKLQTEEVRALVKILNEYDPDLYIDVHVTDGADYQYDVTYGYNGPHAWSPNIGLWLDSIFRPAVDSALSAMGHIPGPLLFAADGRQMTSGAFLWTADPRFSNGYGDARHLPTVLVENHSLKPFRQRVLGTYVFLEAALRVVGKHWESIRASVASDRRLRRDSVPLSWTVPRPDEAAAPADTSLRSAGRTMLLKGVRSELRDSPITGTDYVNWTGEKVEQEIPTFPMTAVSASARRPARYYVPGAWSEVISLLEHHGVELTRIEEATTVQAEMIRLPEARLNDAAFEGRPRVSSGSQRPETREMTLMPGSAIITTDQALGNLVVLLLEPDSPDSFFQWGFFMEVLQRTEYVEEYIMEPMARRMLESDPGLRDAFDRRIVSDSVFAGDPRARLQWFYERTPFFDEQYRLYPVGRSVE